MSAEEAVFTAATARDQVRKSLARMEYHMSRGPRGLRGVEREQAFLNALGRQAARLGAGTAGGINVSAKGALGTRARAAMLAKANGRGDTAGRLKSSLLAEFSQDTMSGARDWTYADPEAQWVWITNASACPACLDNHGKRFQGPFTPMHPSCLCYPERPEQAAQDGVRTLTSREIMGTLENSNNVAFAKEGAAIRAGRRTIKDAAVDSTRRSARGLQRWAKTLDDQAERAQGLAADAIFGAADDVAEGAVATLEGMAEATPAALEEAAEEIVQEALDLLGGKTSQRLGSLKHKVVLEQANELMEQTISDPGLRAKLRAAFANLDEVQTYAQAENRVTGSFEWLSGVQNRGRKLKLNTRRLNYEAVDEYNTAMDASNAAARAGFEAYRRGEISQAAWDAEKRRIQRDLTPSKKGLHTDASPQQLMETLVHEGWHAVDEAADFKYAKDAIKSGQRDEVRRIYKSQDPNGPAFSYAAETRGGTGAETSAELVRMYFTGTGEQARAAGVAPLSAEEWRQTYPSLARWVEEQIR